MLKDNFFIYTTYIMMKWSHTKQIFEFHQTGMVMKNPWIGKGYGMKFTSIKTEYTR